MTSQPTTAEPANAPELPPLNSELEIKLVGDPKALDRLFNHPWVKGHARGRARSSHLVSTYFDTIDGRLTRRGVNLRVRQKGGRFVQTIKTDAADGFLRREWETPLAGPEPRLDTLDEEARTAVGLVLPHELRPVFSTEFDRKIRHLVTRTGGEVELALDRGAIHAEDGERPIAEIELELKIGAPEALYDLALELSQLAPTRVALESKAERGYQLAGVGTAEAPAAVFAEPIRLQGQEDAAVAFVTIAWGCVHHWLANAPAVLAGTDPEAVHQMRVALRRLRSALSVFRRIVDEETARSWSAEIEWLADSLGDARDFDVFAAETLAPVAAALGEDEAVGFGLQSLGAATQAARGDAYARAQDAMADARYARLVLGLCRWLSGPALTEPSGTTAEAFARKRLKARQKRVLRAGRDFDTLPVEARHVVRIEMKKLRYATEFFQSLFPGRRLKPYLKALKQMQDDLGRLNDVAVAEGLMPRIRAALPGDPAIDRAVGAVLGWHGRHAHDVEPKMRADWKAFAAAQPFWDRS